MDDDDDDDDDIKVVSDYDIITARPEHCPEFREIL